MRIETEDRLMTAAIIMLLVGAAMTFLGLGVLAIKAAFGEFGSVGKADPGGAAGVSPVEGNRHVVAGLDGTHRADGRADIPKTALYRLAGNPRVNDREGDVSDVRHEDRPCADAVVEPFLHGCLRDVPELLPTNGTPGETSRDHGAEGSKSCAARHDPLDKRVFHGGDYSKGAAGAQCGEAAP